MDRNALEFRLGVRRLGLNPGWVTCWDGSFFVSTGLGEVIQSHTNLGVSVKVFHRCVMSEFPHCCQIRSLPSSKGSPPGQFLQQLDQVHSIQSSIQQVSLPCQPVKLFKQPITSSHWNQGPLQPLGTTSLSPTTPACSFHL